MRRSREGALALPRTSSHGRTKSPTRKPPHLTGMFCSEIICRSVPSSSPEGAQMSFFCVRLLRKGFTAERTVPAADNTTGVLGCSVARELVKTRDQANGAEWQRRRGDRGGGRRTHERRSIQEDLF